MPRPSRIDDLLAALTSAGGVAETAELVAASSKATVRSAVAAGSIIRVGHGVYTFAGLADPTAVPAAVSRSWARWNEGPSDAESAVLTARYAMAAGRSGALSHLCAAAHHGWPILKEPTRVEIAVPWNRNVRDTLSETIMTTRRDLTEAERVDHVTSPVRTVIDCARQLPLTEAFAVADSALRSGKVGRGELVAASLTVKGRGAGKVREVLQAADGRAANPFESALRAVHHGVSELSLVPQYPIGGDGFNARVDLADPELRLVVEGDSYSFHGGSDSFERTQRRQVELVGRDWIVLPYGFRAVMHEADWVRGATEAAVQVRLARGYRRR